MPPAGAPARRAVTGDRFALRSRLASVAPPVTKQNARGALAVADYGYVVEHGEIALEGAAGELAQNPRVAESYLA